jgi:translation initiation factor IF-3
MEVTGRIKVINPTQEVSASFKKRELVVTTEEQYPQTIMIEFTQAKVDDLNNFQAGEQVKVSINLRGREWVNPQGETKYFNTIQGWRIERLQQEAPAGQPMPAMPAAQAFEPAPSFNEEEHDDLPF